MISVGTGGDRMKELGKSDEEQKETKWGVWESSVRTNW